MVRIFCVFDRECPARGPIPDSSLRHLLFMKLVQLTIDGAEVVKFGTKEPLVAYFGIKQPPSGII